LKYIFFFLSHLLQDYLFSFEATDTTVRALYFQWRRTISNSHAYKGSLALS